MPAHLRALVVILVLATVVFAFAKTPACVVASTTADFERRRNFWFGITFAAFLAHDFWIYIIVAAALLIFAVARESNKLALFFFLLFAVPPIYAQIPGLGLINHLFTIHYIRLLSLVVLLPAFVHLWRQPDVERFGRSIPDKFLAGYIALNFVLQLNADTVTNSVRHGLFYAFVDLFLPYYVASRALTNLKGFRDVLMAFITAALVLSAIGVFEYARRWLLYTTLDDALGVRWAVARYLERGTGGGLRAFGSTGQPIVLGYVIAVAVGFMLYLRKSVPGRMAWSVGLILLCGGLIVPLSRGPWIGAAMILLVFIATGRDPLMHFAKLGLISLIVLPLLLASPAGQKIIDLLPFVGTVESENVSYRQRLLAISVQVILQNPFFGTFNSIHSPAMEELRQGQGVIDVVNTYVGVGLSSGLVGLSLFSGFFISVVFGIFTCMKKLADMDSELHLLGQVLLATLLGILVIIFTVSSISVIPAIYWSVAGLGVAYARMLSSSRNSDAAGPATSRRPIVKLRA